MSAERELSRDELVERDQLVYEMEQGDLARRQLAVELLFLRRLESACRRQPRRLPILVQVLLERIPNLRHQATRALLAQQREPLELVP